MLRNLGLLKNIPPKGVIFSDFIATFAMPLKFLLVLKCNTKISEKSDMTQSNQYDIPTSIDLYIGRRSQSRSSYLIAGGQASQYLVQGLL